MNSALTIVSQVVGASMGAVTYYMSLKKIHIYNEN